MSRFIRIPFGTTGDLAPVPFDTQPDGSVSYAQGFGPDYEIENGEPDWKPVPRPETNSLYNDLSDNIRQYQINGVPDWYDASNNDGVAISYPVNSVVRHDDVVWRSIVATNTVEPGTDATKWVVEEVFSAAATQRGASNYAVAGGSANVLTASLSPALASYANGIPVRIKITAANTSAATLNVNGLGALPIVGRDGSAINAGDLLVGDIVQLICDTTRWIFPGRPLGALLNVQVFNVAGTSPYVPTPGTRTCIVDLSGGGGGGAGCNGAPAGNVGIGGSGSGAARARGKFGVAALTGQTITVGAGGATSAASAVNGNNGGASSIGTEISAQGGLGGVAGSVYAVASTVVQPPQVGGTTIVGANILGLQGCASEPGYSPSVSPPSQASGSGGNSPFGGGGAAGVSSNSNGAAAVSPGAGGSGGVSAGDSTGHSGGAGATGLVIIEEYA